MYGDPAAVLSLTLTLSLSLARSLARSLSRVLVYGNPAEADWGADGAAAADEAGAEWYPFWWCVLCMRRSIFI